MAVQHLPSSSAPTTPGLGGLSDGTRLRVARRALRECVQLMEDRVAGPARPASDGVSFGGSAPRSAVAFLERCGVLPSGAVSATSAAAVSSLLSLPDALSIAAGHLEALIMGRLAPLLASAGPLDAALVLPLARKAAVLAAEVAVADAAALVGALALSSALGSRVPPPGEAAAGVDTMLRRWRREAEKADPAAAAAAHRAAAAESRSAAAAALARARAAAQRRRRKASKPRPPAAP